MSFKTQLKIHFDEADPAGIAFSGVLFTKIHRCYEDFITALGQDAQTFFLDSTTIYPIRHTEIEYLGPLMPLQTYSVNIKVLRVSDSSFQLEFLVSEDDKTLSIIRSTHVCCHKETMAKNIIPENLKQSLESFASPQ